MKIGDLSTSDSGRGLKAVVERTGRKGPPRLVRRETRGAKGDSDRTRLPRSRVKRRGTSVTQVGRDPVLKGVNDERTLPEYKIDQEFTNNDVFYFDAMIRFRLK